MTGIIIMSIAVLVCVAIIGGIRLGNLWYSAAVSIHDTLRPNRWEIEEIILTRIVAAPSAPVMALFDSSMFRVIYALSSFGKSRSIHPGMLDFVQDELLPYMVDRGLLRAKAESLTREEILKIRSEAPNILPVLWQPYESFLQTDTPPSLTNG